MQTVLYIFMEKITFRWLLDDKKENFASNFYDAIIKSTKDHISPTSQWRDVDKVSTIEILNKIKLKH